MMPDYNMLAEADEVLNEVGMAANAGAHAEFAFPSFRELFQWTRTEQGVDAVCDYLNTYYYSLNRDRFGVARFLRALWQRFGGRQPIESARVDPYFDTLRGLEVVKHFRVLFFYCLAEPEPGARYCCGFCHKSFTASGLHSHAYVEHNVAMVPCRVVGCSELFPRFKERDIHEKANHGPHDQRASPPRRSPERMILGLVSLLYGAREASIPHVDHDEHSPPNEGHQHHAGGMPGDANDDHQHAFDAEDVDGHEDDEMDGHADHEMVGYADHEMDGGYAEDQLYVMHVDVIPDQAHVADHDMRIAHLSATAANIEYFD